MGFRSVPFWRCKLKFLLRSSYTQGLGIGGNLPIDGALYAELLPKEKRGSMMVLMAVFWVTAFPLRVC